MNRDAISTCEAVYQCRLHGYALGIFFIFIVAALWAGSSVLIQYIYSSLSFRSPFFLTYLATSLLSLHLPAWMLQKSIRHMCSWIWPINHSEKSIGENNCSKGFIALLDTDGPEDGDIDDEGRVENQISDRFSYAGNSSSNSNSNSNSSSSIKLNNNFIRHICDELLSSEDREQHREALRVAAYIFPLLFLSNCLYNYSLLLTSVSSSTVISNLAASFTLTFSSFLRLEELSYSKILGVLVCFVGAVMTGLQDSDDGGNHSLKGDVIALLASAGYGAYTTMMRYKVPNDEAISMQLLLGYVGLLNALLLSPILIAMICFHLGNVNNISGEAIGFVTLNSLGDTVLADYFWARGVVLTSPTVATIGMSVTIPLAIMTDYFVDGISSTSLQIGGAFLVCVGFALVNLSKEQSKAIMSRIVSIFGFRLGE